MQKNNGQHMPENNFIVFELQLAIERWCLLSIFFFERHQQICTAHPSGLLLMPALDLGTPMGPETHWGL
jgi:hypothetical protein